MSVKQLPHGVIRLINSTQVISSVSSVVKELVENAIDAEATVIDIKLEKYGLEKIEVRDNGAGISGSDIVNVCKPNYTSKLYSIEDLGSLESYGFRGEALNSICAVSQVSITTRTEQDEIASVYTFDCNGTVRETQPSHQMRGTTVTVSNLFKKVPVRKQFYESTRKASEELKKIEKIVKIISVIHPKLRMTISHNKCLIWHKTAVTTLKQSLAQMYPHVVLKNLEYFSHSVDDFSLEMLICKRDCNWSVMCQPLSDAVLFFINRRPVKDKKVEKTVLEEMLYLFQSALPSNKCPLTLISLKLPPRGLDVNLEPDKTKVFIENHEDVLKQIRECIMLHFYKQPVREIRSDTEEVGTLPEENPPKRPKLDVEHLNTNLSGAKFEEPGLDGSQNVPSTSTSGDENLSSHEFEDCDISALEDLLKKTETERSTNIESKSISSFDEAEQRLVESEALHLKSSTVLHQSLSIDENLNASASPIHNSVKECNSVRCVENAGDTDAEKSFNAKTRLSMSGNLVDNLFQSQVADNEEIYLETAENPNNHDPEVYVEELTKNTNSLLQSENISTHNTESIEHHFLNAAQNEFDAKGASDVTCDDLKNETRQSNLKTSNLTQATLSQWSRGHVVVNDEPLKGASIQVGSNNNDHCLHNGKQNGENANSNSIQSPNLLERSVSSQMGRKDLAGLTNFARTARLELIEKNPGMSFTRVASELAKQWRGLDESKKNEYTEKARVKKNPKVAPSPEVKRSTPLIKIQKVICNTSINSMRTRLSKYRNSKKKDIRVIKALVPEKMYICRVAQAAQLVNVENLQKNVLFHRYLCYSNIPSRCLDEPLEITEELLGDEYWNFLLSLDRSDNGDDTFSISDPRIVQNGYQIVITEVFGTIEMRLTGVAEGLEGDMMEELMKTLRLAVFYGDVQSCRTDSLKRILENKVFEACSSNKNVETDDLEVLLEYWSQRMSQKNCYQSNEPISEKLFAL